MTSLVKPRTSPLLRETTPSREVVRTSLYLLILLAFMAAMPVTPLLPHYFLYRQDVPVALLMAVFLVALGSGVVRGSGGVITVRPTSARVALLGVVLLVVCLTGHYTVMSGYALSRDEQLALFDAEIFARGRFAAPVAAEWAPLHAALNLMYVPGGMEGVGWASVYRPVNAAIHMLAGKLGDPYLANPILVAVGQFATWRVARRLLPDDNESQFVAVLLYATSTQVLALGMTSYAMTGHLALNMVWLALFLRDRWYAHLAALAVGFLATGLHQLPYHPMFAGPVLFFCLVLKRRWGWPAFYAVGYAAILLAWTRYSLLPMRELGAVAHAGEADRYILKKLLWSLQELSPEYLWIKAANLLRFLTWQNLILLPLLLVGMRAAVKSRDHRLWALVATIVVIIIFKLVLRPYQGHGWGYRYMHGVVGVACILAAVGWRELRSRELIGLRHLQIATAVTLLIAAPWLLWQAHAFSGLYATQDRAISAVDADVVIVEDAAAEFAQDLVYNPPFLDQRPIRLLATRLTPGDLQVMCPGRTIAFWDTERMRTIAERLDVELNPGVTRNPALRQAAESAGCTVR